MRLPLPARLRRAALAGLVLAALAPAAARAQPAPTYVGIPRAQFDYSYSAQRSSQWCWAAAIQMVLSYYGVPVSQEEIVARSYGMSGDGRLPDWPGSFEVITANLNNWGIDVNGAQYVVQAQLGWGAPPAPVLLDEVSNGRPMIIGYVTGPQTSHAVVATGASYYPSAYGPMVQTVIVRDPWPSEANRATNGRTEYPGAALASQMNAYWIIRVAR